MRNDVGTPVSIISQLKALPACAPVNASIAALRLTTHDSGAGWLAMPFPCDSFIHDSTPVLSRRTPQPARLCALVDDLRKGICRSICPRFEFLLLTTTRLSVG